MDSQYQDNVNRRLRTIEYCNKHMNFKDAIKDPAFSCRSDIFTTRLYCDCNDCIKFRCYGKPIKLMDPYLMDLQYTEWMVQDLVPAKRTASGRAKPASGNASNSSEEPKAKRHMLVQWATELQHKYNAAQFKRAEREQNNNLHVKLC